MAYNNALEVTLGIEDDLCPKVKNRTQKTPCSAPMAVYSLYPAEKKGPVELCVRSQRERNKYKLIEKER